MVIEEKTLAFHIDSQSGVPRWECVTGEQGGRGRAGRFIQDKKQKVNEKNCQDLRMREAAFANF